MAETVAQNLAGLVAAGKLDPDRSQAELAGRLDALIHALDAKPRLFRRAAPPRGMYIWGEVGRGKTLLMDLFFRIVREPRKRRVHFHALMVEVHERLKSHRAARGRQPIQALGEEIARESRLLCLDEFQVRDIADATILGRLFESLIAAGTVIVATSNTPPARLYEKGLNRDLFLPAIALIEKELDVVKLESRTDFRLEKLAAAPVWYAPQDGAAMDAAFTRLTGVPRGEREVLRVQGRDVTVPDAVDGVARFQFSELCEQPLGPGDFGEIARTFHTVLIDGVPRLDAKAPDAVRRFILLIDELYDQRVKLLASADVPPGELLTGGRQAQDFKRTASRLAEMGSKSWLALPHGRDADLNAPQETD